MLLFETEYMNFCKSMYPQFSWNLSHTHIWKNNYLHQISGTVIASDSKHLKKNPFVDVGYNKILGWKKNIQQQQQQYSKFVHMARVREKIK